MPGLTRRAFLAAATLLASTPQPSISLDEFMGLSQRLVARARLDAGIGQIYLAALRSTPGNDPLLARLVRQSAGGDPAAAALERTIIEWWYTGVYTAGGEPRVATYNSALMWMASGAPAPALCATAFGEWSNPPQRLP